LLYIGFVLLVRLEVVQNNLLEGEGVSISYIPGSGCAHLCIRSYLRQPEVLGHSFQFLQSDYKHPVFVNKACSGVLFSFL
jgi:hypothetical protein